MKEKGVKNKYADSLELDHSTTWSAGGGGGGGGGGGCSRENLTN